MSPSLSGSPPAASAGALLFFGSQLSPCRSDRRQLHRAVLSSSFGSSPAISASNLLSIRIVSGYFGQNSPHYSDYGQETRPVFSSLFGSPPATSVSILLVIRIAAGYFGQSALHYSGFRRVTRLVSWSLFGSCLMTPGGFPSEIRVVAGYLRLRFRYSDRRRQLWVAVFSFFG